MSMIASQITGVLIVTQPSVQAQIKGNFIAPRHWPFWGEFTCDWWIPCKKRASNAENFPFDHVIMNHVLQCIDVLLGYVELKYVLKLGT